MGTTRISKQFTISLPPELAAQVEQTAASEHRTVSELFREAFRAYREVQLRKAFGELRAIANANAPDIKTEEDVVRLVKNSRSKRRAMKTSKAGAN